MLKKDIAICLIYNILFSIFTSVIPIFVCGMIFGPESNTKLGGILTAVSLILLFLFCVVCFKTLFKKKMILLHIINLVLLPLPFIIWTMAFSYILTLLNLCLTVPLVIYIDRKEFASNQLFLDKISYASFISYTLFSFLILIYPHLHFTFIKGTNYKTTSIDLSFAGILQLLFCLFCIGLTVYKKCLYKERKIIIPEYINVISIGIFGLLYSIGAFSEVLDKVGPPVLFPKNDSLLGPSMYNEFLILLAALFINIIINIIYRISFRLSLRKEKAISLN